jgi:hypothetical protein
VERRRREEEDGDVMCEQTTDDPMRGIEKQTDRHIDREVEQDRIRAKRSSMWSIRDTGDKRASERVRVYVCGWRRISTHVQEGVCARLSRVSRDR